MERIGRSLATVAAVALVLAACNGGAGGEDPQPTQTPVTPAPAATKTAAALPEPVAFCDDNAIPDVRAALSAAETSAQQPDDEEARRRARSLLRQALSNLGPCMQRVSAATPSPGTAREDAARRQASSRIDDVRRALINLNRTLEGDEELQPVVTGLHQALQGWERLVTSLERRPASTPGG